MRLQARGAPGRGEFDDRWQGAKPGLARARQGRSGLRFVELPELVLRRRLHMANKGRRRPDLVSQRCLMLNSPSTRGGQPRSRDRPSANLHWHRCPAKWARARSTLPGRAPRDLRLADQGRRTSSPTRASASLASACARGRYGRLFTGASAEEAIGEFSPQCMDYPARRRASPRRYRRGARRQPRSPADARTRRGREGSARRRAASARGGARPGRPVHRRWPLRRSAPSVSRAFPPRRIKIVVSEEFAADPLARCGARRLSAPTKTSCRIRRDVGKISFPRYLRINVAWQKFRRCGPSGSRLPRRRPLARVCYSSGAWSTRHRTTLRCGTTTRLLCPRSALWRSCWRANCRYGRDESVGRSTTRASRSCRRR